MAQALSNGGHVCALRYGNTGEAMPELVGVKVLNIVLLSHLCKMRGDDIGVHRLCAARPGKNPAHSYRLGLANLPQQVKHFSGAITTRARPLLGVVI